MEDRFVSDKNKKEENFAFVMLPHLLAIAVHMTLLMLLCRALARTNNYHILQSFLPFGYACTFLFTAGVAAGYCICLYRYLHRRHQEKEKEQ